jgi:hypothetical protein
MKNKLIILSSILLCFCSQKKEVVTEFARLEQLAIPIESNYSATYEFANTWAEGYFIGYFFNNHSIDIFSLAEKTPLFQIELPSQDPIPFGIGGGISKIGEHLFYKSSTSLHRIPFKENPDFLSESLVYPFGRTLSFDGVNYANSSRGYTAILNDIPFTPIIDNSLVSPYFDLSKVSTIVGIYFLDQDLELEDHHAFQFPEAFQSDLKLYQGLNIPFITTSSENVLIQFPFTSDLILYDPKIGTEKKKSIPGKFISTKINAAPFEEGEYNVKAIRFSAQFWEVTWDPYRKLYYRIEKEERFPEAGERINFRRGYHWINVISEDFELLGHFKIPADCFAKPLVAKEGIYFHRTNQENETEVRFTFYEGGLPFN